jgi:predicted nucleic acid-binding protein
MDLVIAATANVHGVALLTADTAHLAIIDDLGGLHPRT